MKLKTIIMAWLAVNKSGMESIFHNKPTRIENGIWQDAEYYALMAHNADDEDGSIILPKGSIKKLIGKELTWEDEAVDLITYIEIK